ncbi:hypothetical protein [Luteimonas sp. 3794]|uniref:hypothetical protein n=1 Tax=Luteimonas sp. 3794 TaxID=2817730 RepID=UPI00285DEA7A|nr:hypothetical protein [Luteimonas sp. 3794]MDR6990405.1 hypothetical protein [Luteimonas sp. 3794]
MTHLHALLPQRDLRFTRRVLGMGGGYLLGLLLLIAAGGMAWWQAPGLIEDQQIRSNPLELEDYLLRDGRCTTRKAVLTDCEADVAYEVDGVHYEKQITLMFLSVSRGDYEASLVVAADDPSKAALSIGLERYWNRVAFFLVVFGVLALGGIYSLVATARNNGVNRAAQQPQRWIPELVDIKAAQSSFGGTLVTYAYGPETGRRAPKENSRFGKREEPLLVDAADGEMRALALRPVKGGKPLLLDAGLRRIDLTETEREAAFAVLNAVPVATA